MGEVVGVHQELVARAPLGQPLGVVHPGVAVLLVASADEQQSQPVTLRRSDGGEPGDVGHHERRRQVEALALRRQPVGQLAAAVLFGVLALQFRNGDGLTPGSPELSYVREIATVKQPDLNANDVDMAARIIAGTARSMGITSDAI